MRHLFFGLLLSLPLVSCKAIGLGGNEEIVVTERDQALAGALVAYMVKTVSDSATAESAKDVWVPAVRLWAVAFYAAQGHDPLQPPPTPPQPPE